MYPNATVSIEDLLVAVDALHRGFHEAYRAYLEKAKGFANPPVIGPRWPGEGYFLPGLDVFAQEVLKRTAPPTLAALGGIVGKAPGEVHGKAHGARP